MFFQESESIKMLCQSSVNRPKSLRKKSKIKFKVILSAMIIIRQWTNHPNRCSVKLCFILSEAESDDYFLDIWRLMYICFSFLFMTPRFRLRQCQYPELVNRTMWIDCRNVQCVHCIYTLRDIQSATACVITNRIHFHIASCVFLFFFRFLSCLFVHSFAAICLFDCFTSEREYIWAMLNEFALFMCYNFWPKSIYSSKAI